jgi:hypothetical protein
MYAGMNIEKMKGYPVMAFENWVEKCLIQLSEEAGEKQCSLSSISR